MTLARGLTIFGLETVGLVVAVMVVGRLLNPRWTVEPKLVVAAVLVVVVIGVGFQDLEPAGSALHRAQASAAGPLSGLETCLGEDHSQATVPFVQWLRRRLPANAIYAVQTNGEPDLWCVTLVLLPRLLAFGDVSPRWVVTFGRNSPELRARVARHDPSVEQYAPGYALIRGQG